VRDSIFERARYRSCIVAFAACLIAGRLAAQEAAEPVPIGPATRDAGTASYPEPYAEVAGYDSSACTAYACAAPAESCSYYEPPGTYWDGDTRILRSHFLGRLWVEGEYLAWSARSTNLPPLVSARATTPPLDQFGTLLLFGGTDAHGKMRSGGRLTAGYWFTPEHCAGIEANFFEIDGLDIEFNAYNDDAVELFRPIINADNGSSDTVPITTQYPGYTFYSLTARSNVDLLGSELLWRQVMSSGTGYRLDWVAGYRYVRLYDGLSIDETYISPDEPADDSGPDYVRVRSDWFESENEFHGGEFGLIGRWWGCRWALQTLGKLAAGGTRTTATVDGQATTYSPKVDNSEPSVQPGGVLALPSNIGYYGQSEAAAVVELGVRLEYALTKQLRATFGYTYIYWSSVSRIPDSIDPVVDTSQIWSGAGAVGSGSRPTFAFDNRSFWTQGLSVGLHYDF
jgi:hypothetical protein